MSNSETISHQTIREMARLALLSNRINEVQEKNLKMYPLIFFDGVIDAKIDYDFSSGQLIDTEEDLDKVDITYKFNKLDTKNFRVSYFLTIDPKSDNNQIDKRFQAIESSVRNLFWKEVKVEVYFNNELKYPIIDDDKK